MMPSRQSPRRSPPRRLNRSPRQLLSRSRQLPQADPEARNEKTPVLNAAGQPTASAAPAENGDGEPADNTKESTETPPPAQPKPRLWTRKTLNCRLFRQNHEERR
jgi:hypothetical protein